MTRRFRTLASGAVLAVGGLVRVALALATPAGPAASLFFPAAFALVFGVVILVYGSSMPAVDDAMEKAARAARAARQAARPAAPRDVPPIDVADRKWHLLEQPWTLGEGIGLAMRAVRRRFPSFVPVMVASLLAWVLAYVPPTVLGLVIGVRNLLEPRPTATFVGVDGSTPPPLIPPLWLASASVTSSLALLFGQAVVLALAVETALAIVRGEKIPAGRIGRAFRRAPKLALFLLPWALPALVTGGMRALGVPPNLVFALLSIAASLLPLAYVLVFAFVPFVIVDEDASIASAFRKSWRTTKHCLGRILLFYFAIQAIAILVLLPFFGGVAEVFVFSVLAYGYVRATGKNDLEWFPPEYGSRSIRKFLLVLLAAFLALFGGLVVWVGSLSTARGSTWSIFDTAVRASAIVSGVFVVILLLSLLLPFALDRLEGRTFTSYVAARHVRSQKSGFLTVISVLSILGVAMSSCSLSSVVSVMGGFSQDLKRKILGNNAHIVVDTTSGTPWESYDAAAAAVRKVPGVTGATAVVHGEVMASSASNLAGVIVTGIDPKSINGVIDLQHNIEVGKLEYLEHPEMLSRLPPNEIIGVGPRGEHYYKGADLPGLPDDLDPAVRSVIINQKPERPGIILGRELAKTLHVYVGDEITLVSPLGDLGPMGVMPRTKRFRVAAVFYSGMYEYDATYVYTLRSDAQEYFATGDKASAIEIKVEDAERADLVTPGVIAALGRDDLRVRDWREINKNLFSALKLERFATFIILSVAILVASFCIVCTLLLMVTEKGKEIAILKAVGASDGSIMRIFMTEGIIIGGIGATFGVATGLAVCVGLSWFGLRLDPDVYYIDRLPISVNASDFFLVGISAMTICAISTIYPAYAASRLRPVDGLRYE